MPDALFTVPYPEHAHFVGREEDLERLHAALQGEGPVGINPAAMGNPTGVTGQGGIGKTQLAVAYAYRYREHYPDGVYWLNAAEGLWLAFAGLGRHFLGQGDSQALKARLWETLRTRFKIEEIRDLCFELGLNYEEFSPQLGISSLAREVTEHFERRDQLLMLEAAVRRLRGELAQPEAQDELVRHAFAWLRDHSRSLLILDNLAEPAALEASLTRDCVPARLPGPFIFTTRRRELGRFRPVELKTLPSNAAVELLLRDPRRQPILNPAHPEHKTAQDICAVFGYLPLALEIAAAHLAKLHTAPLSAYREELRRRGALDVIADRRIPVVIRHETGLVAALMAQWAILGTEAQLLLRVAGQLLEAAYIPSARLGLLASVPDEGSSFFDVTLTVALAELQDASLVEELAGDQLRLHPLVREFARDRTPIEEKAAFRVACVRRLLAAFSDIKTLERQCDARGIDAIILDLLAGQGLLKDVADEDTRRALGAYLRVLRREAHNLRAWRRVKAPGFLAQQLHLRLLRSRAPALFGDLPTHLRRHGPTWLGHWAAGSESPELEMTLAGHRSEVQALAVTPDGRRVLSGGKDGVLRVWDLDTGRNEMRLTGHAGGVKTVCVTPDGQWAISSGDDGKLHIWNISTGERHGTLAGSKGAIWAIALTRDGRRAIIGGKSGVSIWNLETGEEKRTLTSSRGEVRAVAVVPNEQRAVSGGKDGIRIWNLETGECEKVLPGHIWVQALIVTSDGRQVVSAGFDNKLYVWDLATGQSKHILTTHTREVRTIALMPDGRRVISGGFDGTLRVWDLHTSEHERTLVGHVGEVNTVALTPDGQRVISGGEDKTLRVWNLDIAREKTVVDHTDTVWSVAMTPDGQQAVFGGKDGIRVWDLSTGASRQMPTGHAGAIRAVATTHDGRRIITGGDDRTLRIWNLNTGELEQTLVGHTNWVQAVAVTPDGQLAVSGGWDWTVRVWDLNTGQSEHILVGHKNWVQAVAVTPDGRLAVSSGEDGTLYVWNLDTGRSERRLTSGIGIVWTVAVTPDGRQVISGKDDGTVQIWNLETGRIKQRLTAQTTGIRAVAVTPDGRQAISGGFDGTLRSWDLVSGRELASATLDAGIICLDIAPGSPPLIVAGDAAGNVYYLEWVE